MTAADARAKALREAAPELEAVYRTLARALARAVLREAALWHAAQDGGAVDPAAARALLESLQDVAVAFEAFSAAAAKTSLLTQNRAKIAANSATLERIRRQMDAAQAALRGSPEAAAAAGAAAYDGASRAAGFSAPAPAAVRTAAKPAPPKGLSTAPVPFDAVTGFGDAPAPAPAPKPAVVAAREVVFAAASVAGPQAAAAQDAFDLARRDELKLHAGDSATAMADYAAFNRAHLSQLPDGTTLSPRELGLPEDQTPAALTKITVDGLVGLRYEDQAQLKHWQSLDGTLSRDDLPGGAAVERRRADGALTVTTFDAKGETVDSVKFAPGADGLFVAESALKPWPRAAGRFTQNGFAVEELRNQDGSRLIPAGPDAPNLWSVYGDDGKLLGWSVEAEGAAGLAALAAWVTAKRGADAGQARPVADMLAAALRADGARARIFFLPDGRVVVDLPKTGGVRQLAGQFEGADFVVYARDAAAADDPDTLRFARQDARAGGFDSPGLIPIVAKMLKVLEAGRNPAPTAGAATSRDLRLGGAYLQLAGLSGATLSWSDALLETARASLGFAAASSITEAVLPVSRLTPAQQAEYRQVLSDVRGAQTDAAIQDKLAERYDIRNPTPEDLAALRDLKDLQQYYDGLLLPAGQTAPGYAESVAIREAQLKALRERLDAAAENRPVRRGDGIVAPVDDAAKKKISDLIDEIEALRSQAKGELANRDATTQLLAVQSRLRDEVLKQRRDGKNELAVHQNLSRLDTVVRASFALKIILQSEAFITQKIAAAQAQIKAAQASSAQAQKDLAAAQANAAQAAAWKAQAAADVKSDQAAQASFAAQQKNASMAAQRFAAFQTDVSAEIAAINGRDKGASADALTEYVRRLNFLPTVVAWRTNGNPNDPNAFSLKQFNDLKTTVHQKLSDAQNGLAQLQNPSNAVNFAGVVINAVPGPSGSFTNRADLRAIITARKADYQRQRADYQKDLDSILRMMGQTDSKGNSPGTTVDEFGDAHPESLPKYRDQSSAEEAAAQGRVSAALAQIDAAATQVNSVAGSNIPMLSGRSLADLQSAIKTYGDVIKGVHLPGGDENDAQHLASMNLVLIADLLPKAADDVITWSEDDGVIKAVDDAMTNTLPPAKSGIAGIVAMVDAIVADCDKDLGWINGTSGESNQGVFDRKLALVQNVIIPPLKVADGLLDTLIAYQRTSIAQAQPNTGDLWTLYDAKRTLMTQTQDLYNTTLPWAVATFGGTVGDAGGSHASIKSWRDGLAKYMSPNGYADADGQHESILQYQQDVAHRKDPNYGGTETLYGETQPYSLPKKISQYAAERGSRVPQINSNDQQVNDILGQIEALAKGKYSFGGLRMPVGVTNDAAGVSRVQAVVDAGTINQLSDALSRIGNDANANSGTLQVGSGSGNGTFPTGTQPPIVANDMQRIALMSVDAAKRLVPTPFNAASPDQGNATFAIARFLYSDSVVSAAQDALQNQVPVAEAFLNEAASTLNAAIASTGVDDAYVDSNGKAETPDQVYRRQIALFQSLDRMLLDANAFFNQKISWDQAPANPGGTIDKITSYYNSLAQIANGSITADQNIVTAQQKIIDALQSTFNDLEKNRVKLAGWLAQLDDPHDSALRRVNESISDLQDQTRAVLEQNLKWHDLEDQLARSNEILKSQLTEIDDKQNELRRLLADPRLQDALPPDLVARIDKLRLGRGMWDMQAGDKGEAIVIKKSQFSAFVDTLFGMLGAQSTTANLAALKGDILNNPQNLASLLPDAQVINFGDNSDGFYLVYQTQFAVPDGLNTSSWVTLGNVARLWGNNISVTGYQFASPPNDQNAPYGDKGVQVDVESLQGRNWVNYLNIDLHRFAFDIPANMQPGAQLQTSRLMVFDDFAVMAFGDRLYVGAAGFGDMSMNDPGGQPSYYGGNLKTSLKLTEVMKLNAEQQVLFAKDPQAFLQTVNVTGADQYLNGTIYAKADDKNYYRTQIGPSFDVGRLISNAEGKGAPADTFTVDLFWSKTGGSDDINQQAVGASILKGFTIKDDSGKPWAVIQNKLTGEVGRQYDTLSDRLSVTLPNYGIVISGQGQLLGNAQAYYGSIAKKLGDNSNVELAYGSPYVGMNDRLSLTMNSSFTLGQLWSAVAGGAKDTLEGGPALQQFNRNLDEFFKSEPDDKRVAELKRVWEQDVARRLLSQDMGALARKIVELRRAGALLDNTRVRGMVGYVTNAISNDQADLAVGGGFTVGTQTDVSMKKTPKAEIDADLAQLYVLGLQLQNDLIDTIEKWQGAVVDMAQAQWELKADTYMMKNGPTAAMRQQATVKAGEAEDRLHQALIAYNILTGRNPTDPIPFDNLTPGDLDGLTGEMRKTIAAPTRLLEILKGLDPDEIKQRMGNNPFNLADYLPIIDQFTLGVGVQLQDLMANQIFGIGAVVRLPLYDPSSKAQNRAYVVESKAAAEQILQAYAEQRLRAQKRRDEAKIWQESADSVRGGLPEAAQRLGLAIRSYRNGLSSASELQEAFDAWHWYITTALNANGKAALEGAWASVDASVAKPAQADRSKISVDSIDAAIQRVYSENHGLAEIALRGEAAADMTQANDHRIQKAFVDLHVGMGLTASGAGWIPSVGVTGIPVTPVLGFEFKPEELRELEVHRDQSQTEYYKQLQAKVRSGLAVQFAQNVIDRGLSQQALAVYDAQVIPGLEKALADAQAGGGDAGAARRALDDAKLKRDQVLLSFQQANATLNFLLGRDAGAPLQINVTPEAALASLRATLARQRPVDTQRRLLDSRVEVARSVETMVDKDLKVEQLALEPVSLVVRSLSRLITALGGDAIGNPDLVAAARVQTLTEERAREAFDGQLKAAREQARSQLSAVEAALDRLGDSHAPDAALTRLSLEQRAYALRTALLSMDDGGAAAAPSFDAAPTSFYELQNRLEEKERQASPRSPDAPVELLAPERLDHQASSFLRYYYAHQTLGMTPIDKNYAEGWIEVRLKSQDTPPEVLLALAKLREEKADRVYNTELSGAEARADILTADFQANVELLRWARRAAAAPGALRGSGDDLQRQIVARLNAERDEIAAKLNLGPDETLERLMAVVPDDAAGARDLPALADAFLAQERALRIDRIRKTLFDGALPPSFGTEDNLINQLKADTIAERMSYKGFTPVAAFGIFRGQTNSGLFLEAPDPRAIQSGLETILTDALRKELLSDGRMQELTLKLHSLMSRVEDGARELEKRRDLVALSESEYKAMMGRAQSPADLAEAEKARERLVTAWLGFSDQMSRTRADFISLVTELEALGADGQASGLRPYQPPVEPDLSGLQKDSRAELLAYWADRFRDYSFDVDGVLGSLDHPVPDDVKARLRDAAANYRLAIWNADVIRHKDFSDAEKMTLLSQTDVEGQRLALVAVLDEILTGVGPSDPATNGDGAKLMKFLRDDIEAQGARAGADKGRYDQLAATMRDAYWKGAQGDQDPAARDAYARLEREAKAVDAARQKLLERYLVEAGGDANRFILKDLDLDAYLAAQDAFDADLIATLQKPETRNNRQLALTLDALYGVRDVIARRIARTRAGRGMAALDALIMLENARLAAARWNGLPPDQIDRISLSLENLKTTRERWNKGSVDLSAVYAVTGVAKDGARQWSVDGWMTQPEVDAALAAGTVTRRDGKLYLKTADGERELVGGVDAAQARRDAASGALAGNENVLAVQDRLARFDYAAERPAKDGAQGWSVDQIFGPGGKHAQGRVFFFEAPQPGDRPGRLHSQLHPLKAMAMAPDQYVMVVYDGDKPLSRDRFPTLESLRGSDDAKDFIPVTLSAQGAAALRAEDERRKAAELGQGWVDVKLNSFGFARDKSGAVSEIYTTEDDFKAVTKAFQNAARDLAQERRDLAAAQAAETALKDALAAKKDAADSATLDYQRVQLRVRTRTFSQLTARFPRRQADESEQVYQARFKIAWDKLAAQDPEYLAAQKKFEPVAKAFNDASEKYKQAHAKALNAAKAVDEGVVLLDRSKTWSLYRSDNLALGLARDGTVVSASGVPVYGSLKLADRVTDAPAASTVAGPLYAAELDSEGRLKTAWQDPAALAQAAASWKIKTVAMQGENDSIGADGRAVKPTYRLSHYEDDRTGLAVALSRRYMAQRAQDARSKLSHDKHWGLMPWNWGDLALELPRSIVGAPIELITGRDPNQQHYLGRVYMYKTEGGETEHHGFFRTVLGVVDVLDLLPDPVSRFYDPSQFPSAVQIDSPVLPGQSILDKTARDASRDVHFGMGSAQRTLDQSVEDLATARARTLAHFHGGVSETLVEDVRGRAGEYEESRRTGAVGDGAIDRAVDDPLVGDDPNSDGSGLAVSDARPGNIAVDRVQRQVLVTPGADQFARQADALQGYADRLARSGDAARQDEAQLRRDREAADAALKKAVEERQGASRSRVLTDEKMAWWRAYLQKQAAAFAAYGR